MLAKVHSRHFSNLLFFAGAFIVIAGLVMLMNTSSKTTSAFGVNELVDITNSYRGQMNKNPLIVNNSLMNAAQTKAEDMAAFHYFGNVSPDGVTAWDYFKKSGYKYGTAGENIAITNKSISDVADSWIKSSSHKDNLLNNDFRDIGIGIAKIDGFQTHSNTSVVVAFFGKASGVQLANAPTNPAGTVTVLRPDLFTLLPTIIISIGVLIILFGAFVEIKRIRRQHNKTEI